MGWKEFTLISSCFREGITEGEKETEQERQIKGHRNERNKTRDREENLRLDMIGSRLKKGRSLDRN
jgi:hypothetical protein